MYNARKRKRSATDSSSKRPTKTTRVAGRVPRGIKAVAIAIRNERRWHTLEYGNTVSTTCAIVDLNLIGQGDDNGQRHGMTITPQWGVLRWTATGSDSPANIVRFVIFSDTRNSGAGTTGANMIQMLDTTSSTAGSAASSYPWLCGYNMNQTGPNKRYVVLKDWSVALNQASNTTQRGKVFVSLKKLKNMEWNSTAATYCLNNALMLGIVSDSSITTHPSFVMNWTMVYDP